MNLLQAMVLLFGFALSRTAAAGGWWPVAGGCVAYTSRRLLEPPLVSFLDIRECLMAVWAGK